MRRSLGYLLRLLPAVAFVGFAIAPAHAAPSDETLLARLRTTEQSIEVATVVARTALLSPGTGDFETVAGQLAALMDGADGILARADGLLDEIAALRVRSTTRLELVAALQTAAAFLGDARRGIDEILSLDAADPQSLMRTVYASLVAALGFEDSSFTLATLRHVFAALPDAEITVTPGDSIQAAIDRVLPGGIVRLQPGTYTIGGPIAISKDVLLLGPADGEGRARIEYPYAYGSWPVLDINTTNLTEPVTITIADVSLARGIYGVEIASSRAMPSHVTLQRVEIEDCERSGFAFFGGHVRMEACASRNNGRLGLQANFASILDIYDSTFTGNGEPTDSSLSYLIVAGLHVFDESTVTLDGCTIASNRGPGLLVEDRASLVVRDCDLLDNLRDGILLWDTTSLTLRDSRILRNGGMGIRCYLPDCAADPTSFISHFFTGSVSGARNRIPAAGAPEGNAGGSLCPNEYRFLAE